MIAAIRAIGPFLAVVAPVTAAALEVQPADWEIYQERFITSDGRVVDTANDEISHSEGQGYGMLLAVGADDPATFERIWTFTRNELLIRDDGLAAWKWDPAATPHISDVNNATDGDILIAYALMLAGDRWGIQEYTRTATQIAETVGAAMLVAVSGLTIVLPGNVGFRETGSPGNVVINLSYWVFPALRHLQQLAPDAPYDAAIESGMALLAQARFGPLSLPSDWLWLENESLAPAPDRPPLFGYDGLRIPLYLLMAGLETQDLLSPFVQDWLVRNDGAPSVVNVTSGEIITPLEEPGYRFLAALVGCATDGTPIPDDLRTFSPTLYYPSTLHLLGLSVAAERSFQC